MVALTTGLTLAQGTMAGDPGGAWIAVASAAALAVVMALLALWARQDERRQERQDSRTLDDLDAPAPEDATPGQQ